MRVESSGKNLADIDKNESILALIWLVKVAFTAVKKLLKLLMKKYFKIVPLTGKFIASGCM